MKSTFAKVLNLGKPIGLSLFAVILLYVFLSHANADNTIGSLSEQKSLLTLRIEQTQAEYAKVAAERQDAQEYCNIANEKAEQLKQLAELNGARRDEIKAIDQKLATLHGNLDQRQ